MSEYFNSLPDVDFVDEDTEATENRLIQDFETKACRTLYPADPYRILIQSIALAFSQLRTVINFTGKQNLLKYAQDGYIENIAVLSGTTRIAPRQADTILKFTISAPQTFDVVIPKGTRATAGDGIYFATEKEATIKARQTETEVKALCTEAGEIGNGYMPGQINKISDPFIYAKSVINTKKTSNGGDIEEIENFRERTRIAPEAFSTAGPEGAYQANAKKAHQNIIDVYAGCDTPGIALIVPLMKGGEPPTEEILQTIQNNLNEKSVRPMTDKVIVQAPETMNFNIDVTYYINSEDINYEQTIKQSVETAINNFAEWQKEKLGRGINPDKLIAEIIKAGAAKVEIRSPTYTELSRSQVAIAKTINIQYGGMVNV